MIIVDQPTDTQFLRVVESMEKKGFGMIAGSFSVSEMGGSRHYIALMAQIYGLPDIVLKKDQEEEENQT